ncbi:N-acetylmuramoyl-L-alanine amidase [Caldicellulosiruptoraceae bacterium PP1]
MTKKIIILICIFTLMLSSVALSNNYRIFIDNKEIKNISITNKSNIIYVSIYDLFKNLNYKIDWNSKTKEIILLSNSSKITFKINSNIVFIDKKQVKISTKPTIINQRSYLNILDLSNIIAYNAFIDKKNNKIYINRKVASISRSNSSKNSSIDAKQNTQNTVNQIQNNLTSINYSFANSTFQLKASLVKQGNYKVYKLEKPTRIVLDIYDTNDILLNNNIKIDHNGIKSIRHAINKDKDGKIFTRIVVDVYDDMALVNSFKAVFEGNNINLFINLNQLSSSSKSIDTNIDDETTVEKNVYNIEGFSVEKGNLFEKIIINCSSDSVATINEIANSNYIVLRIKDALFKTLTQAVYDYNDEYIDFIGINQNYEQKITEFIISKKSNYFVLDKTSFGYQLILTNNLPIIRPLDQSKLLVDNALVSSVICDVYYSKIIFKSTNDIIISNAVYSLNEYITTIEKVYDKGVYNATIYLKPDVVAQKTINQNNIVITFNKKQNKKFVIYLDPGHGGKDPGAIYKKIINGKTVATYNEKDFNLDISLRLKQELLKLGYEVYMTREDDRYIDLYERTDMANKKNADLFISIHNNAHDSDKVSGTMVLYKNSSNTNLVIDNKQFANIVLNEIINYTLMQNKGIIERPNLAVLRTSNMSAVLVEVAYGTNQNDLDKLLSDDFKNNVAKAIATAVEKIFINRK